VNTALPLITSDNLAALAALVCERDPRLAPILAQYGTPPLWAREPGFETLLRIILEQQVSLASARATFERLVARVAPLTPDTFLRVEETELRTIGFSRQKMRYARELAYALQSGTLSLKTLHELEDETVRAALTRIKGIGTWTAEIYLLMALGRPDSWPSGDLALAVAYAELTGLPERPSPRALEQLSQGWRPYRAVVARLLWHDYLSRRRMW
jgi:DNA-3-methyladenine glycosylase II